MTVASIVNPRLKFQDKAKPNKHLAYFCRPRSKGSSLKLALRTMYTSAICMTVLFLTEAHYGEGTFWETTQDIYDSKYSTYQNQYTLEICSSFYYADN